ncbi:MAG: hypothetical protein AB1640_19765 [bacterium]
MKDLALKSIASHVYRGILIGQAQVRVQQTIDNIDAHGRCVVTFDEIEKGYPALTVATRGTHAKPGIQADALFIQTSVLHDMADPSCEFGRSAHAPGKNNHVPKNRGGNLRR